MNTETTETDRGWILYDGDCAFCRGWVARGYRMLRRRGFKFAALQAPRVSPRFGLPPAELLREMRLVKSDGQVLGGADALLEIARTIWWAQPVCWAGKVPGIFPLMRTAYRWFAARRHCLASSCPLPHHRASRSPGHSITSGFYELP